MSAAPVSGFEAAIAPVTNVSDFIWGGTWEGVEILPIPPMVVILLGAGVYFMIGLRGYPLRRLFPALAGLFKKSKGEGKGEISPAPFFSDFLNRPASAGKRRRSG